MAGQAVRKKQTSAKTSGKTGASGRKKTAARSGSAKKSSSGRGGRNQKKKGISFGNEILILATLAVSVLFILSNFGWCGVAGEYLKSANLGIFGWFGYVTPFLLFLMVCFLIANQDIRGIGLKAAGAVVLAAALCGIGQMFAYPSFDPYMTVADYYAASGDGSGGGVVGGLMCMALCPFLGAVGSYVVLAALAVIGLVLLTERSFLILLQKSSRKAYDTSRRAYDTVKEDMHYHQELHEVRRESRKEERARRKEEELAELRRKQEEARKARFETPVTGVTPATRLKKTETREAPELLNPSEAALPPEEILRSERMEEFTQSRKSPDEFYGAISGLHPEEPEEEVVQAGRDSRSDRELEELEQNHRTRHMGSVTVSVSEEETKEAPSFSVLSEDTQEAGSRQKEPEDADEYKTVVTKSGKVITVELDGVPGERKLPPPEPKQEAEEAFVRPDPYIELKEYEFPPLTLLKRGAAPKGAKGLDRELKETAIKLQQTLQNFGVGVTVTNISRGPAVTRYELQPEQGVKVSRIVALTDDIKLNLAAADIRMEAPIPGKAAIGIEVPNKDNSVVMLRDILEGEDFKKYPSRLAFAVGKDIAGQTVVADIAKMPHLLIAGATGSGKSVCINTLIMSIIYKAKPSEVKLLMVDPKVVELSVYNGIPHLLIPVVTDPKKAAGALNWAVAEMTDRYKKFAEWNVRDMKGYNQKVEEALKTAGSPEGLNKMPQIVIIVDELADLMMVASGEVEDAICRLAQMARAAGIHLVIATQRPSVNVITGLIKANVPSRIAFAVSSGVDSRTIIDMNGAEKLLGKGDMLFYPYGYQKPVRIQGAFVSDQEVSNVVEFLSGQTNVIGGGHSDVNLEASGPGTAETGGPGHGGDKDEYFSQAGRFIIEKDKASIGMLQRAFKIGFNRAARIMDQLAEAGVVGEEEGTKPRKILMTMEEFHEII